MVQKGPRKQKLFNFRNTNHSEPKILESSGAKLNGKRTVTSARKIAKIWVYLARWSSFLEIFENF